MDNVIIKFTADTTGLEPAIKQLALMGKITDEDAARIAEMNAEQKKFNTTVDQTTNEFKQWQKAFNGVSDEIKAAVIVEAAKQMGEFTHEATEGAKNIKSLKTELRELKAQIASGSLGEKEMREATKRAAELTDHLGDVQQKIKALSSDTKRIDAVVEGFRGIAAAASVASGAIGLFGNNSKQLEQTLLKVQSAMALLQGVQELANLATSESIVKTYALAAAEKTAAVASKILGVEIAASTALATGGLTLLTAGLAYLISEMGDTTEEVEALKTKSGEFYKSNEENFKNLQKLRAESIQDSLAKELRLNQIAGNEELDILKKKYEKGEMLAEVYEATYVEIKNKYSQKAIEINKKFADANEKIESDREAKLAAREARIYQSRHKSFEAAWKEEEKAAQVRNDMDAKRYSDLTDMSKNVLKQSNDFHAQMERDNQRILDKETAAVNKALQAEIEAEKAAAEQKKQIREAIVNATLDTAQLTADTLFTISQQNRDYELQGALDALQKQKEATLLNKSLTDQQKIKLEERYQRQENQIKMQAWKAQQEASIAQALINGALAVTNILANLKDPTPTQTFKWIQIAAQGAATAAQVAIIKNAKPPKFEKGGMIDGNLHINGGTLIEAERGEYVINRHSTSDYLPVIEAINERQVDPLLLNTLISSIQGKSMTLSNENLTYSQGNATQSVQFDYERLGRIVERGKSKVNISITEKGFEAYVEKVSGRTNYLNKKFKFEA